MIKYYKNKLTNKPYGQIDFEQTPSFIEIVKNNPNLVEITEQEFNDLQPKYEPPKPTYEQLVQEKLIAKGYDKDRQIAILCNKEDGTEEHIKEFNEMQKVREQCKKEAKNGTL